MDEQQIRKIIKEEIGKALLDPHFTKRGFAPNEFYELVNKGFLQQHGPTGSKPSPSTAIIGQMYYDTSGNGIPIWVDSAGANWRDAAGNIVV